VDTIQKNFFIEDNINYSYTPSRDGAYKFVYFKLGAYKLNFRSS